MKGKKNMMGKGRQNVGSRKKTKKIIYKKKKISDA